MIHRSRTRRYAIPLAGIVLLSTAFATDALAVRYGIKVANYAPDTQTSLVRGRAPAGVLVEVSNADTGAPLGSAEADARGVFKIQIAHDSGPAVPCNVRAATSRGDQVVPMNNAPEDCDREGPGGPHASISSYEGPATCIECHESEALEMHGSVHYQQSGPTDYVTNIEGPAGERGPGAIGINTYCGTHENSPRFTCAGCHVGNGRFPKTTDELIGLSPTEQFEELSNIDCLTCHQDVYKRFPDWTSPLGFETLEIVSPDPVTGEPNPALPPIVRTGLEGIPVVDPITLDFQFLPAGVDTLPPEAPMAPMPITTLEAARTVHATTRKTCLNCHAGAAGGDGYKRGDLSSLLADPPIELDMHMSKAGADLTCSDCHNVGNHRVQGRGLDLRPNDVPERFSCESCHDTRPHGDYSSRYGNRRDTHAGHVACQSCHIPEYGKGIPTEVNRDWEDPHFSEAACNGRGGWLPREDKLGDLIPSYGWFDGTSEIYYLGESLDGVPTKTLDDGSEAFVLGKPNGGVGSPGAKLYPMKEHTGKLALHLASNTLVGHSTFEFFRTGSFEAAVLSGMVQSGLETDESAGREDFEVVPVHTYQTINHGVEEEAHALACGTCHASYSEGGPIRMDLQGKLGYEVKGNYDTQGASSDTCTACHSAETKNEGNYFFYIHDKHVRDKGKDCSVCHSFSRPERSLSTSIEWED
ncbi:MAG: hypothetical protein U9Q81_09965 [Pseudomonadota bacterium]|nr:hypothetical protein [Pseudomonadota bacterium]